jgi:hypothetical protein
MSRIHLAESAIDLPLDDLIKLSDARASTHSTQVERRRKPRVAEPFPATILGSDSVDLRGKANCTLDNISATGLYLRIAAVLEAGSPVRVVVHLWRSADTGATVALDGHVLRSELQADGKHGHAIQIQRHRFL